VTDGPFPGSPQQLFGFSVVTCHDDGALVEAAEVLLRADPVVEARPAMEF
jgi:hypothetical protein